VIRVDLAIVLRDVRRWLETPRVGSRLNRNPKCWGAEVIRGCAPTPPLRGMVLRLSVAPGLDGVTDVVVVTDLVVHGGTPRRKVAPLLLPGLGAPSLWLVRAVARRVTATFHYLWGVSVGAVPIRSSRHVGQPGERDAAPRC
jgi:hypothetical protein